MKLRSRLSAAVCVLAVFPCIGGCAWITVAPVAVPPASGPVRLIALPAAEHRALPLTERLARISFEPRSAAIDVDADRILGSILPALLSTDEIRLVISATAVPDPARAPSTSVTHAVGLAEARAEAVRRWLLAHAVAADRMRAAAWVGPAHGAEILFVLPEASRAVSTSRGNGARIAHPPDPPGASPPRVPR